MKSLGSSYGDKGQVSGIQKGNNGLTHLESTFAKCSKYCNMCTFSARPFPSGVGPSEKRKFCGLRNHNEFLISFHSNDYFFNACAFIIRLNTPFYTSIIGLFRLIIKKEFFFLKKFVVLSCVFAFFVVPLYTNLCNYAIL